jgi:hypothetical protein
MVVGKILTFTLLARQDLSGEWFLLLRFEF